MRRLGGPSEGHVEVSETMKVLDAPRRDRRPAVAFLVWGRVAGRAREIAHALDGEARAVWYPRLDGRLVALRYAWSAVVTAGYLVRRRPRAVIATNPPIVPGLLGLAYARATGAALVLDSHPSAFGRKGDRVSARLLPVHAWLARRADATLVTTHEWVDVVERWGGHGIVVHEAPSSWSAGPIAGREPRRVLFVGVFGADEPVEEVVGAARRLPTVQFDLTGDPARCPSSLRDHLPDNVRLVGYLEGEAYRRAFDAADLVLALTTEPTSVMRVAYEAVWAGRPLIVSDWPALRHAFPYARHVGNDAAAIADGVRASIDDFATMTAAAGEARDVQMQRWEAQAARLSAAVARRSR